MTTQPCPICGGAGCIDRPGAALMDATCTACGWHYTTPGRRLDLAIGRIRRSMAATTWEQVVAGRSVAGYRPVASRADAIEVLQYLDGGEGKGQRYDWDAVADRAAMRDECHDILAASRADG